jgi:hypothetical protein
MTFTKKSTVLLDCFIFVGLLLLVNMKLSPVTSQEMDKELMKQSSIIFIATVTKLNAVSFSQVPASDKNAVLRVENLLEKPAAVSIKNGQEVTIQLKDPSTFHEGTKAMFYAVGWILGEGVALLEVGHTSLPALASIQMEAQVGKRFGDAKKQILDERLRAQIESADIVALGKVISIREAARAESVKKFITEHDPDWQEAVIKVKTGIKNVADGEEIVVRFPSSEDVVYFGIPKFKKGEERVVLLMKDKVSGFPKAMLAGKQVETYVVEKPADVLPKEECDRVKRIAKQQ